MLLEKLNEYADRIDLPPPLYTKRPLRYVIDLDSEGRPMGPPIDLAQADEASTKLGLRRLLPTMVRSSGIRPILLADNAVNTLGPRPGASAESPKDQRRLVRAVKAHGAYLDLLHECADVTGSGDVTAVCRFLDRDPWTELAVGDDFDEGAMISFRVDGRYVVDEAAVQEFWADHGQGVSDLPVMQCVTCGRRRPTLRRLKLKIKGIPGGHTTGTSLISANEVAFESYGLKNSQIAPTCMECGERFTQALNALLASSEHSLRVADLVVVFWTRDPAPFSLVTLLSRPDEGDVRRLLDGARTGQRAATGNANFFYAAFLSGSDGGGRAAVRQWIDSTVPDVEDRLRDWFLAQRIVENDGSEGRPIGVWGLSAASVRDMKDVPAGVPASLMRAALTGAPLPYSLLHAAVRRSAIERSVTHSRAALIKLVLTGHETTWKENDMVELEAEQNDPAYQCGRLLAVLENAQYAALRIASVTDRFYGAASTAPASVFGRLVSGSRPHLAKLRRDRHGAYNAIEREMEEVMSTIDEFPNTLTLREQGMFALGYYHQRAAQRRGRDSHRIGDAEESRQEGQSSHKHEGERK